MEYSEFKTLLSDVSIENSINLRVLEHFVETFERLGLEAKLKYFYPKGIYRDENMELFFFCENQTIIVQFSDGEFSFLTIKNNRIKELELIVSSGFTIQRKLFLSVEGIGNPIKLDSSTDTESSHSRDLAESIDEIYQYLFNASTL
ncbi:hypothetical protein [Sediminibacillus terrae]|uniref:hypothetical protein n=1 Tax=Sediminibacillus terrae TaxID=1562106 RepID=UPI001295560F|nr:hypothetical protein [Sediminibacillus terrae]